MDEILFTNEKNNSLDNIFDRALNGNKLVKNQTVLNSEYIPENLPFREKQITLIGQSLAPILKGSKCSNLLLYGKTGTGKTVVAKYVTEKLCERANNNNLNVRVAYSNTRMSSTGYRILLDLANSLNLNIPFTGLSIAEVLQRITDTISKNNYIVIFVLDEIDYFVKIHDDNLLYELTRSYDKFKPGLLSVIGISNDLNFKEYLNPRVLSSLSEEEIVFPPYTAEEIKAILQERAIIAFEKEAFSQAAINLCSALAGSEHGDARRAVDLLRIASEVAERENANRLEEKHIRSAVQKIERDRVYDALNSLPIQAKVLLIGIINSNEISKTGDVYEKYKKICDKIGLEFLTQRRVSSILSELDLLGIISASVISNGRYGRTKKITSSISKQIIIDLYSKDQVLSVLF